MNRELPPIISVKELAAVADQLKLVIVDASGGKNARQNYGLKHLKGALYADVNTDLAAVGPDAAAGGRHPLPSLEGFSQTLGKWGIDPDTHVVVYDDMNGANAAARLWWMLKAIGHQKVQVLSGGLQAAEREGFPVESGMQASTPGPAYPAHCWALPLADIAEVEAVSKDASYLVIDVRDANRYAGLTEPIDLIAGHIPGAVNIPFSTNLDVDGLFKSADELKQQYSEAFGGRAASNVIVHCGSGVTACHTLLAADHAGLPIPKLYVGSWSEWSRNDKEMVTASSS